MKTIKPSVIIIVCFLMVYGCKPEDSSQPKESSKEDFLRPTLGVVEDPPFGPGCSDREDWRIRCLIHCEEPHPVRNPDRLCLTVGQEVRINHTGTGDAVILGKIGEDICKGKC